jgi:hypothetical protein
MMIALFFSKPRSAEVTQCSTEISTKRGGSRSACATDSNSVAPRHLEAQALGEAGDEVFGPDVGGEAGEELQAEPRADVEDAALAAGDHAGEELAREVEDRGDVGLDLLGRLLPGSVLEEGAVTQAGVVDEDIHLAGRVDEVVEGHAVAHVADDGVDGERTVPVRLVLRAQELLGELLQALLAARGEDQALGAGGELARELPADARGSPGDECGSSVDGWTHGREGIMLTW